MFNLIDQVYLKDDKDKVPCIILGRSTVSQSYYVIGTEDPGGLIISYQQILQFCKNRKCINIIGEEQFNLHCFGSTTHIYQVWGTEITIYDNKSKLIRKLLYV